MIVSETEAEKLFCPLTRQPTKAIPFDHCIASKCMLWRWRHGVEQQRRRPVSTSLRYSREEPVRDALTPKSWTWVPGDHEGGDTGYWLEPEAEMFARREGFCGLSGSQHENVIR